MADTRPTLNQLRSQILADVHGATNKVRVFIDGSVENKIANSVALVSHGIHGRISNVVPYPTKDNPQGLFSWATLLGITRNQGTKATGALEIHTDGDSYTIDIGATLTHSSTGSQYVVTGKTATVSSVFSVNVEALAPGVAANLPTDAEVRLDKEVEGVDSYGTVLAPGLEGGAEPDSIEKLETMVHEALADRNNSGGDYDLIREAKTFAGVTRVKPMRNYYGANTVLLIIVKDAEVDFTGDTSTITAIRSHFATLGMRGEVVVSAPEITNVAVEVRDFFPDNPTAKLEAQKQVEDLFYRRRAFQSIITTDQIDGAIASVDGYESHTLISPASSVQSSEIGILRLTSMNFTYT